MSLHWELLWSRQREPRPGDGVMGWLWLRAGGTKEEVKRFSPIAVVWTQGMAVVGPKPQPRRGPAANLPISIY